MTGALETLGWAIIAAVAAWGFTLRRAAQHISRLEAANRTEVAHWKNETARARAHAAQVTQDKAAWAAGCQQGRDDVISVVPLIIAARDQAPAAPGDGASTPSAPATAPGPGTSDLAGRS
jgi:hypothetical protein